MFRLRVGLADAETQSEFSVELGVGEEEIAAAVETVHDGLIGGVSAFVAEAHKIQRRRSGQFEVFVCRDPLGELLRQLHVAANVVLQAFDAVVADHEPQLQRAEAAAELDVPVAVVDDRSRFGGLIAQVFGQDAERLNERFAVGDPEAVAIEVGEHPFVRIEVVAVGEFDSVLQMTKFRAERRGA